VVFLWEINMQDGLKREKLNMWNKKLADLEKELEAILMRKGEAAAEGDLSENAAYKMAAEDADTYRARIAEVKKIISDIGGEDKVN
jgi:transcription elongation GreA/GreB family factor